MITWEPGYIFHVQPDIGFLGGVQGQLIILQVILAHPNFGAIAGIKLIRFCDLLAFSPFLLAFACVNSLAAAVRAEYRPNLSG